MAFIIFDSADKDHDSSGREWFAKLDIFNWNLDEIEWNVDEHIAYGLLNKNTINTFIDSQIIEKTFDKLRHQHLFNEQIFRCIMKAFELMDDHHLIRFAKRTHLFDILLDEMKLFTGVSCTISPLLISKLLSSNALMYHHKETLCKFIQQHQLLLTYYRSKSDVISPQIKTICTIYRSIMMEHVFGSWTLLDGYFRDISKEIHIAHDVIAVIHRFLSYLYHAKPSWIAIGGIVEYKSRRATIVDTTILAAKVRHEQDKPRTDYDLRIPQICLSDLVVHYHDLPKKFMINSLCALMPFTAEMNLRIAKLMTHDLIEKHGASLRCTYDNDAEWVWLQFENGDRKVVKTCEIEKIDLKDWYAGTAAGLEFVAEDVIVMSDCVEWRGTKAMLRDRWNGDFAVIADTNHRQKLTLVLFDFLCPINMISCKESESSDDSSTDMESEIQRRIQRYHIDTLDFSTSTTDSSFIRIENGQHLIK
eukprot:264057_1